MTPEEIRQCSRGVNTAAFLGARAGSLELISAKIVHRQPILRRIICWFLRRPCQHTVCYEFRSRPGQDGQDQVKVYTHTRNA